MVTEHEEDRLRQLLRDDGWSLPVRPGAEARVRRTARRQRLHTASASAVACALAAAAVVLPLRLIGAPAPGTPADAGDRPAASHSAGVSPTATPTSYTAPPVGAPGFPADIYPPPKARPAAGLLGHCPGGTGVQPFGKAAGQQAVGVLKNLGHTLGGDLRLTDRTFWPIVLKERQVNALGGVSPGPGAPILYQGPLVDYSSLRGPPDLDGLIAQQCGAWLSLSTWLIVTGPADSPALQSEMLFINRHGHVLLYYEQ